MKKSLFALLTAAILLCLSAAAATGGSVSMAEAHPAAGGKMTGKGLSNNEYIRTAAEAIHAEYPDVNPLDEAEYKAGTCRASGNGYTVRFVTNNVRHGDAYADISADGTVIRVTADREAPDGDSLLYRYWIVYGDYGNWDQQTWIHISRDMQELEPAENEGKLIKATVYPEESTVRIGHEEAKELGIQRSGDKAAEVKTCVLVDAEPNPVWIMLLLTSDGEDRGYPIYGFDAETGELMFSERYCLELMPTYVLYTNPEIRRAFRSARELAMIAVILTYADSSLDDPDTAVYDEENWETVQDGLTVRFTGRWKGMKAYETELDMQGNVLRCERKDSPSTAEKPQAVPEEDEAEPTPTPQPDGKPWIWGNRFAPEEYWNRLADAMDRYGVTFDNLEAKELEWTREYGWDGDWPQDLYVITDILETRPEYLENGGMSYPVFENPDKKTKEEIEQIAWETFREAAEPITGAVWMDRLHMVGILWDNGAYEYLGIDWQKPAWCINFLELEECWENKGYVLLDEDGNILTVQVEPYGGG